jgi:hypothetical protein
LEIYRQVFSRSTRMGISYVILGIAMGLLLTGVFNYIIRVASNVPTQATTVNVKDLLSFMVVPFGAMVGLIITTPIYLLFVADKNTGLLEYLLAVGMGQRDVFWGYLKASFLLSLVGIVPMLVLNLVITSNGLASAVTVDGLSLLTGLSDVALVTVLMTAFSSMQRKPTGMNSPIGISIGIVVVLPEFFLTSLLGSEVVWLDLAFGLAIFLVAGFLLTSIGRIIVREKLLP